MQTGDRVIIIAQYSVNIPKKNNHIGRYGICKEDISVSNVTGGDVKIEGEDTIIYAYNKDMVKAEENAKSKIKRGTIVTHTERNNTIIGLYIGYTGRHHMIRTHNSLFSTTGTVSKHRKSLERYETSHSNAYEKLRQALRDCRFTLYRQRMLSTEATQGFYTKGYGENKSIHAKYNGAILLTYNKGKITYDKNILLACKVIEKFKEMIENELSHEDIAQSLIENDEQYFEENNLYEQKKRFLILDKALKKTNIKKVIPLAHENDIRFFCPEDITLINYPQKNNTTAREITEAQTIQAHLQRILSGLINRDYIITQAYTTPLLQDEKVIDVTIKDANPPCKIGQYYESRNVIILNTCLFTILKGANDDASYEKAVEIILKPINELNIKKKDVKEHKYSMMCLRIQEKLTREIDESKHSLDSTNQNILDHERQLTDYYREHEEQATYLSFLETKNVKGVKALINALESAKNLDFIEDITIDDDTLITFKPLYMKVDFIRGDGGMSHGIRQIYVGKLTFKLTEKGILVTNPQPIRQTSYTTTFEYSPHPHVLTGMLDQAIKKGLKPCLGKNDGGNAILKAAAINDLETLPMLLYMWAQCYNPSDCCVKPWILYDDRLCQGYPVLDEDGTPIAINDPERIKSGEQIKLTPYKIDILEENNPTNDDNPDLSEENDEQEENEEDSGEDDFAP